MILPLFALLAVTAPPSVPTVSADSIWKDGYSEIVHYSTTRPGSPKAYESTIEVRKQSGPAYYRDAGGELGATGEQVTTLWMIFRPEPADSGSEKTTLMFRESFQPEVEMVESGSFKQAVAPISGEVFYDGLPVWLRGFDLTRPSEFYVPLKPTQLSGDSTDANSVAAKIHIVGPAGRPSETSHGGLEVDISYGGKLDRLWFHPGPGHVMLVWERADGTTLTYRKSERRPFE